MKQPALMLALVCLTGCAVFRPSASRDLYREAPVPTEVYRAIHDELTPALLAAFDPVHDSLAFGPQAGIHTLAPMLERTLRGQGFAIAETSPFVAEERLSRITYRRGFSRHETLSSVTSADEPPPVVSYTVEETAASILFVHVAVGSRWSFSRSYEYAPSGALTPISALTIKNNVYASTH